MFRELMVVFQANFPSGDASTMFKAPTSMPENKTKS